MVHGDRQYEWWTAIIKIILKHDNRVNYDTLYNLIPNYIELYEHEWIESGKDKEILWRGELRKYISIMRKDGVIETTKGEYNKKIHSVVNPEEYNYLL